MNQKSRIFPGLVGAVAVGLSCTACLGTSALNTAQYAQEPPPPLTLSQTASLPHYNSARPITSDVPIRLQDNAVQSFPSPQTGATLPSERSGSNGIDLTVRGFAQSINPDRNASLANSTRRDANYSLVATRENTGLALDLAVRPHVSVDETDEFRSSSVGAQVRIGQNLDQRGRNADNSSWYFFAGADGEALVWDVQRVGAIGLTDGLVTLQDRVTVGDVQAGVAWESPAGQMSVSYIERDYEYRNGAISRSGEEDFVALTLTWRR